MRPRLKAVTLLELLIAITLLAVIVVAFTSIDVFTRFHVLSADRRAKIQNEVSFVLEHMNKNIAQAIGNRNALPINRTNFQDYSALRIRIDSNNDGRLNLTSDLQIAYAYNPSGNQILYFNNTSNPTIYETISSGEITSNFNTTYVIYSSQNNYLDITMDACWKPLNPPCGTSDNPSVTMNATIIMPSVSTN